MDRYTKFVLSVIAVALCVLVVQNAMPLQTASATTGCGASMASPCYISLSATRILGVGPEITVRIKE